MEPQSTIGDDFEPVYEFQWDAPDHPTQTSEEIGDLDEAGFSCTIDDIVAEARMDDACTVNVIGF
jgi:hypothetical protein